jgi:hypothetical protein
MTPSTGAPLLLRCARWQAALIPSATCFWASVTHDASLHRSQAGVATKSAVHLCSCIAACS